MNIRKFISIALLALAVGLIACRRDARTTAQGGGAQGAAVVAGDSASILMERVDHYYKNVLHDSLYAIAPTAMDYFRQHYQWKEYYTTWCLLVNDLVWNGQMDKGLEEAQRMHQDAITRRNDFGIAEAYTAMGIAYHFQGNNDESIRCYKMALGYYPKDADQSVKQNIFSYYCQVLVEVNDEDAIYEVFTQWRAFLNEQTGGNTEDPQYAHWMYRFHRESYRHHFARGHYDRAAMELDAMEHFLEKEDDREVYETQVAGFRSQLAMARKDYATAIEYNDLEIALSKQQDFNTFLNALKHRSDMLQQLGRYEEALIAWRSYDQQKDSLTQADTRNQLNELNKRFEVDELKAQQAETLLSHQRTQLRLTLLLAAIVVTALVLFILFRQRSTRRLNAAYHKLEQSNRQLSSAIDELKVANARAEESSRMKTDFIQQISHEIRTPLNILCGFSQIITDAGEQLSAEERADINTRITENTNRITGLVNKMLELSDASSQTVIEQNDDVPLAQIAVEAIDETGINGTAPTTDEKNISFTLNIADDVASTMCHTNEQYAARALAILLDNARKFTNEGSVTLTVHTDTHGVASFVVDDTGIGVPPEEAEHIFGEFVQLDEFYDGTGIGLTIARSIARRMGGDVVLDTTYHAPEGSAGPGARFVMTLPLLAQTAS